MIIQGVKITNTTVYDSSFNSNGALLYVNAGNTASYPGSGTTWTDLSGNTNNGTLVNSPVFTNVGAASYFSFSGIGGAGTPYVSTTAAKFNKTYTGKTVIIAARMANSSFSSGQFRCLFGTNGGTRNFNTYMYFDGTNFKLHYSANGLGGFSNNLSIAYMQWFVLAVTHTTGGLVTYYLNGVPVGTNTGVTFAQYASNNGEFIALGDNLWYGDINTCAVYGRALSGDEIQQNYNAISAQYSNVSTNLVAYYNPDLTSSYPGTGTTLFDISGNGLNGTMSNITYTDPYFAYNGTSSQVNIPDNALLEPGSGSWTMEAWVYLSNSSVNRVILGKFDPGGGSNDVSYSMRITSANAYAQMGDGAGSYVNSTLYTLPFNTWKQIVYVWKNGATKTLETFVNGSSIGSVNHSLNSILNTPANLYIGSYNGGEFDQWMNGRIGIVRLYNAALTAGQVSQNFNANKATYGL
jgi:hypothetical protein